MYGHDKVVVLPGCSEPLVFGNRLRHTSSTTDRYSSYGQTTVGWFGQQGIAADRRTDTTEDPPAVDLSGEQRPLSKNEGVG